MENWEIQKPGFLDKTPSFSDVPAFLAVLGSPGMPQIFPGQIDPLNVFIHNHAIILKYPAPPL